MTNHQTTIISRNIIKLIRYFLFCINIEVNKDIPAKNQIKFILKKPVSVKISQELE